MESVVSCWLWMEMMMYKLSIVEWLVFLEGFFILLALLSSSCMMVMMIYMKFIYLKMMSSWLSGSMMIQFNKNYSYMYSLITVIILWGMIIFLI